MTAKNEQETVIRFDAASDEATVWTACPTVQRKLQRAGLKPYNVTTRGGEACGWFYRCPVDQLRWKIGRRKSAPMTAERKAALAAGLAAARAAKQPA